MISAIEFCLEVEGKEPKSKKEYLALKEKAIKLLEKQELFKLLPKDFRFDMFLIDNYDKGIMFVRLSYCK